MLREERKTSHSRTSTSPFAQTGNFVMEGSKTHLHHFERLRDSFSSNAILKMHFGNMAHNLHELTRATEPESIANVHKDLVIKSFDPNFVSVSMSRTRSSRQSRGRGKIYVRVGKLLIASEELPKKKIVNISRPPAASLSKPPPEAKAVEESKTKKKKRAKNAGLVIPQSILEKRKQLTAKTVDPRKSAKLLQMLRANNEESSNNKRSKLQQFLSE